MKTAFFWLARSE